RRRKGPRRFSVFTLVQRRSIRIVVRVPGRDPALEGDRGMGCLSTLRTLMTGVNHVEEGKGPGWGEANRTGEAAFPGGPGFVPTDLAGRTRRLRQGAAGRREGLRRPGEAG